MSTMSIQADWGPLKHVRVIKERSTGVSRGFAFVDFPDVVSLLSRFDVASALVHRLLILI